MLGDDEATAELAALWSHRTFPLLVDDGETIVEASIIVEHLGLHRPGPIRLIPADPAAALPVRFMDRFFDNFVMTPMQKLVFDALRPADARDPHGLGEAKARLDTSYRWLDDVMHARRWATGEDFTLADCAAAPSLLYADWAHPIGDRFPALAAYRARLLARPSFDSAGRG